MRTISASAPAWVLAAVGLALLSLGGACTRTGTVGIINSDTSATAGTLGQESSGEEAGSGSSLDLPDNGINACIASDGDMMGVGACEQAAPADAFEASIQWTWPGAGDDTDTRVIPLVINVTDDDDDGDVDLCDTPDIIVTAGPPPLGNPMSEPPPQAHLYALDGASGAQHWRSTDPVRAEITPAAADLDGDGSVEIVTLERAGERDGLVVPSRIVVFNANGELARRFDDVFDGPRSGAVALADLDGDGDGEILVGNQVFDHAGSRIFEAADVGEQTGLPLMPLAVDLDGDGDLEALWSRAAYHHDGSVLWAGSMTRPGFVHVANLDSDPDPELIVTTDEGLILMDAMGNPRGPAIKPVDAPDSSDTWRRPAAIHDIDGDRRPELLLGIGSQFVALGLDEADGQLQIEFDSAVQDPAGSSAGTAFDFLGDGSAEAMYADEQEMFVYDVRRGGVAFSAARSSVTVQEYPVVADVDNDGSAEIVIGSSATATADDPTIRVISDAANRWVQARRVWNEHTYHVTNVGEDGRLPRRESRHWQRTNTFRTNAQIEAGAVCLPEP